MKRIASAIAVCLAAGALWADSFVIGGTILVDTEGTLFVHLVDEAQFGIPFTGIQEIQIEVDSAVVESGVVDYRFLDVPTGRYGIRVYIDTNGNGELDRGLFGPKEPWGMSWQKEKLFRIPSFRDVAFVLNDDLVDLTIDTR